MRIADVLKAIKDSGMSGRWSSDYKEYRVNYVRTDYRYRGEATAYFTDNDRDAIETAIAMFAWHKA